MPYNDIFTWSTRQIWKPSLRRTSFVNEVDNQDRAAHKILGYDPIQKSFTTLKYVIRAKDPRLHRIAIAE